MRIQLGVFSGCRWSLNTGWIYWKFTKRIHMYLSSQTIVCGLSYKVEKWYPVHT